MAVNKNFVVKNGLEVDTNTLFVDSANNRVAIGTTVPTATLDVRGKILSNSQVESFVGKFVGIVTAGAVGVTTMTTLDAVVTGFSTLGLANATSLNVTLTWSSPSNRALLFPKESAPRPPAPPCICLITYIQTAIRSRKGNQEIKI